MAKTSFVLRALNLLGLEDILNLSEILHVKQIVRKKAAGEELIVWEETEDTVHTKPLNLKAPDQDAKILDFPKVATQLPHTPAQISPSDSEQGEETYALMPSELVMWQRELGRQTGERQHKRDAFNGYSKATEMFVAKDTGAEGKPKNRVVSTNGVLVNKKQA